ncbi:phage tail protein [Fluviibacterium sp. DFM31]|uniref:Phage tail protein n=1 Tax=Meridianimarinicoccus marinus TaxID=3231483 RepID=A0ABV3L7C1_9RHOB
MAGLPRLDPLPAFNFYVVLVDDSSLVSTAVSLVAPFVLGGFAECSGLESEMGLVEYRAGGVNDRVHKFPDRFTFPNIVLSRGVGFSEDIYLWHEEFLQGEGKRRNGMILLANEMRVPIKSWSFERGLPIKWTGPSLNAGSSALSIERLEIAHEKLTLMMSPGKALDMVLDAVF